MTRDETKKILRTICALYPNFDRSIEDTLEVWTVLTSEIDFRVMMTAVQIRATTCSSPFAPSFGELTTIIREKILYCGIPSEQEALTILIRAKSSIFELRCKKSDYEGEIRKVNEELKHYLTDEQRSKLEQKRSDLTKKSDACVEEEENAYEIIYNKLNIVIRKALGSLENFKSFPFAPDGYEKANFYRHYREAKEEAEYKQMIPKSLDKTIAMIRADHKEELLPELEIESIEPLQQVITENRTESSSSTASDENTISEHSIYLKEIEEEFNYYD